MNRLPNPESGSGQTWSCSSRISERLSTGVELYVTKLSFVTSEVFVERQAISTERGHGVPVGMVRVVRAEESDDVCPHSESYFIIMT